MAAGSAKNDAGTAARILDVAERLVQVRGFNGFSYADISAEVGITKAALHYHFAGKADLGLALITGYAGRFAEELAAHRHRRTSRRTSGSRRMPSYTSTCSSSRRCACAACLPPSTRPCRCPCKRP